jgi:predicted DNA-binding transcriptional regulator AlpA
VPWRGRGTTHPGGVSYAHRMGRRVDLEDLVDAHEVAALLGLARATSVHVYQRRYPDMPRPVLDRGGLRARFWLRSEILAWQHKRNRRKA